MAKPFAVIDAETDPFKHGRIPEPFIWGFYDGSNYREFTKTSDLVEYIADRKITVYAHNGGKFDFFFLLDALQSHQRLMIINGRLAKFRIGECELRDSYSILPIPLRDFAKDEIDYRLMERVNRNKPGNMAKIRAYLKSDCKNLYDLILQFREQYGTHLTLATAAIKTWAKMSGEEIPRTTRNFYETLQPYYYGGRVQCFRKGIITRRFQVLDINSAYPFAMTHEHPYGDELDISDKLPSADIERAFIRLRMKATGCFPLRTKDGLEFPNDGIEREFTVTGWEYVAAEECGLLPRHKILDVITLSETVTFYDYVTHFYRMKKECAETGDKAGYIFAKLFQNSCYGKFAANPDKYSEYTVIPFEDVEACTAVDGYEFESTLGPWALMSKPLPEEQQHYYNVATGASITGFVRAMLMKSIVAAKGVLYCDTDSIACENRGSLEIGKNLGQWKVEAECVDGAIAGKKLYAFRRKPGTFDPDESEFKIASKGVKLTAEEIYRVARGETIEALSDVPTYSIKGGVTFQKRKVKKTVA